VIEGEEQTLSNLGLTEIPVPHRNSATPRWLSLNPHLEPSP
jgi:hypothetical protein